MSRSAILDAVCVATLAFLTLAAPATFFGCGDDDGGEDVPVKTAELKLQFRRDDGTAANADYAVSIRWAGQVVTETSSEGATSFDVTKEYSGKTDSKGDWTVNEIWFTRRPGTWEITVEGDGYSHTCNVELEADTLNIFSLTWGKDECAKGAEFP